MAMLLEDIVQAVEMWVKLRRKQPQMYVDPNLDPVLLVPGIAGSILKAVDNENRRDERVWVRILGADYKFRTKLWSRFDPSTGRTVSLDQKTSIVVPEDRYGLHAIDMLDPDLILGRDCVYYYHDMIVEMLQWGFQEGKTLFGFGYDFRQSNRLEDTLKRLAAKLESVYEASRGKKINIITHSMGGLLVKSFMCLYSDIFEKYVKNWIAIAAPFRGAPGYVTSTFLNGVSFVDGWEQNFFISKWSMHQLLIECPSIYELMPCPDFNWQHIPVLEIWREKQDTEGNPRTILESYCPNESIEIFKEALSSNMVDHDGESIPLPFNLEILKWANETHKLLSNAELPSQVKFYNIYATGLETPHSVCYGSEDTPVTDLRQLQFFLPKYVCVDGDGTVPTESAKIIELVYQRKNIFLAKKREDYGVEYGEFIGYDMMCDYDLLKIIKDIKSSNVFSVLISQADGLNAEARVGVPGEHRGILSDHQVFRILKHWLKADADPYYNPLNDYVILPTAFEMESHQEKGLQVTSFKEEWEIISGDQDNLDDAASRKPMVSSISISQGGKNHSSHAEAHATVTVHPQNEGKHHVELNAISVSVDA